MENLICLASIFIQVYLGTRWPMAINVLKLYLQLLMILGSEKHKNNSRYWKLDTLWELRYLAKSGVFWSAGLCGYP